MYAAIGRFLRDESGVMAGDWAVLASVLVLGSALGVAVVRRTLETEARSEDERPQPRCSPAVPGFHATPPDTESD
jgi:hypothetical protein